MKWTRRSFIGRGLAAALAAAFAPKSSAAQRGATAPTRASLTAARGAVVLCSRGERWGRPVNAPAWAILGAGGSSLDAVVAGANVVELEPEDTSVGYGGLPNEEGVVQIGRASCRGRWEMSG